MLSFAIMQVRVQLPPAFILPGTMATNHTSLSSATCTLCSEIFVDPRMLQCLHTFCSKCLKKVVEGRRYKKAKPSLECPTCKARETLPKGGIDALPKDLRKSYEAEVAQYSQKLRSKEDISCDQCVDTSNGPAVSFCVNCCEFLCNACSKHHKSWRKTLSHELQPVGGTKHESKTVSKSLANVPYKPLNCQLHEDETLKFYCNTCSTLICRDCMAIEHSGHTYDRIEKVSEKEKANLQTSLNGAEGAKAKLEGASAEGGKVIQQLKQKQKEVEQSIRSTFKMLVATLSEREKSLLAQTAEISLGKQTALTMQGEELQKLHREIAEACELIKVATQVYNPAEMLSAKGLMTNRLQQLMKCFKAVSLEPCRNDMISSMLDTAEVVAKITSFGEVFGGSYPNEAKTDFYLPRAVVGQEKKITITTSDIHGKPFPHGGERVEVSLSLMGSNDPPLSAKVIDRSNGTYIASFTPLWVGENQLSITIDSTHIKGSPIPVYVRQQREYTGNLDVIQAFSPSSHPSDVAVDDNGNIYIALYDYACVQVYGKDGTLIRTIGTPVDEPDESDDDYESDKTIQLQCPSAIAIHGNVVYVAEYNKNCVQKITTSGEFISIFGEGQLHKPRGICIDSSGRVYVSSSGDNSIAIFEADGTFITHIGERNLNGPWGLAFDSSGNLHVADTNTNTIKVFTGDGGYVTSYDSGVNQTAGIAIDDEGNTFVAEQQPNYDDYGYNQIESLFAVLNSHHQVISSDGATSYDQPGHYAQAYDGGVSQFAPGQGATGITLDKDGSIYVCDFLNCQVQKY